MAVGSFKLPISAAAGGGGGINYSVTVFTSSGTYTKPSDLDYAYVLMVSGGTGGRGGRRGAASSNRGGGYGFNGGIFLSKWNNADLSATESVTIGAGGAGGASVTTNDTSATGGATGGSTQFKHGSSFQVSTAPSAGGATSTSGSNTGSNSIATSSNIYKGLCFHSRAIAIGSTTSLADDHRGNTFNSITLNGPFNNTSMGGVISSGNTRFNAGGLGGFYNDSNTLTDEISGTAPEANGVQPASFYTFGQYLAKIFPWFDAADANYNVGRGGLGGGCGDLAGTIAGGTGAAGLGYGAGGGGGGASTNGANSGAGGAGTGGIVIIINVLT